MWVHTHVSQHGRTLVSLSSSFSSLPLLSPPFGASLQVHAEPRKLLQKLVPFRSYSLCDFSEEVTSNYITNYRPTDRT